MDIGICINEVGSIKYSSILSSLIWSGISIKRVNTASGDKTIAALFIKLVNYYYYKLRAKIFSYL